MNKLKVILASLLLVLTLMSCEKTKTELVDVENPVNTKMVEHLAILTAQVNSLQDTLKDRENKLVNIKDILKKQGLENVDLVDDLLLAKNTIAHLSEEIKDLHLDSISLATRYENLKDKNKVLQAKSEFYKTSKNKMIDRLQLANSTWMVEFEQQLPSLISNKNHVKDILSSLEFARHCYSRLLMRTNIDYRGFEIYTGEHTADKTLQALYPEKYKSMVQAINGVDKFINNKVEIHRGNK